ncbi:MAG TPA: hypothetical protein PKW24_01370 [Clostridiales bacterium]|nr:hypothetical protein [Clostridiales bacterium]HRT81994.1 hypothetical protein [Oscillospiraceae bacterium]
MPKNIKLIKKRFLLIKENGLSRFLAWLFVLTILALVGIYIYLNDKPVIIKIFL